MKKKYFECPESIRNYEKKNTWNFRRLVDESFVPSAQRTSVLYCRLTDFWCNIDSRNNSHARTRARTCASAPPLSQSLLHNY